MKSTVGFILALIGGILSVLGGIYVMVMGAIASSNALLAAVAGFMSTFFYIWGIWMIIMGIIAIIAALMMNKPDNSKVKKGGIIGLIVGILGMNILTIIGGIVGIVQANK